LQRRIAAIAPLSFSVLIQGEPGTGKEMIAQELHALSGRSPLITVDCTGLTGELFTSELFGHDRGAFTGAFTERVGLIEAAGQGTVFLDEIGELEPSMQSRLLRFLQEKEYRRLGSNKVRTSGCRIIAATNRNLTNAVREGTFRADLYERLRVIEITSPPLRERCDDLVRLISHFSTKHAMPIDLSLAALNRMREYSWPGNVRELEHLIIRLGTTCAGRAVTEDDLPPQWDADRLYPSINRFADGTLRQGDPDDPHDRWTGASLEDVKMRRILQVVAETGGHLAKSAEILGIGRTTLYRRLKKIGACREAKFSYARGLEVVLPGRHERTSKEFQIATKNLDRRFAEAGTAALDVFATDKGAAPKGGPEVAERRGRETD
jgi:DNA-binding NtrC family response regulator